MNWFERYGIPGLYFVLLVTILCCVIFGLPYCKNQRDIAIKAFVATLPASVPIGYILVIFSQMLVYCDKIPWWRVHSEAWKKAGEKTKNDADKEWWVEAEATIRGRWKCTDKDNKIEKGKWLQEWFTKRFDVLAINSALILATIFGWGLVVLGRWFFQKPLTVDYCRIGVLFLISCLVVVVLVCSNCLLTKQARHVATEYYRDLRKEENKTQTSSSHNHAS